MQSTTPTYNISSIIHKKTRPSIPLANQLKQKKPYHLNINIDPPPYPYPHSSDIEWPIKTNENNHRQKSIYKLNNINPSYHYHHGSDHDWSMQVTKTNYKKHLHNNNDSAPITITMAATLIGQCKSIKHQNISITTSTPPYPH